MNKITNMYLIGQKHKDMKILKEKKNLMKKLKKIKKLIKILLNGIAVNKNLRNLVTILSIRNLANQIINQENQNQLYKFIKKNLKKIIKKMMLKKYKKNLQQEINVKIIN